LWRWIMMCGNRRSNPRYSHFLIFDQSTCNTTTLCDKIRMVLMLICLWYNETARRPRVYIAAVESKAHLYRGYTHLRHQNIQYYGYEYLLDSIRI
jgi:hypothetical protein